MRSGVLSFHAICLRIITSDIGWAAILHNIMSGIRIGFRKWSRIAPATAEKAKPAKPQTTPPRKTAAGEQRGMPLVCQGQEGGLVDGSKARAKDAIDRGHLPGAMRGDEPGNDRDKPSTCRRFGRGGAGDGLAGPAKRRHSASIPGSSHVRLPRR